MDEVNDDDDYRDAAADDGDLNAAKHNKFLRTLYNGPMIYSSLVIMSTPKYTKILQGISYLQKRICSGISPGAFPPMKMSKKSSLPMASSWIVS